MVAKFYIPSEGIEYEEPIVFVLDKRRPTIAKEFKRIVDLGQFSPEEVQIMLADHVLTVSGVHKEESELGSFEASFTKKLVIPKGIDLSTVTARINEKAKLEITGKREVPQKQDSISIPINFCAEEKPKVVEP